jgi:hypothetical protein
MMRLRQASVITVLLLLAWTPRASAQESASPEAHELARLILSSAGSFDAALAQAGRQITAIVVPAVEGRLRRSLSVDERSQLQILVTQVTKETLPRDLWVDLYARLYSKHASPAEITDMLTFYNTPVGRRALSLSVIVITESAEAGFNLFTKSREQELQKRFSDALSKTMPGLKAELDRAGQNR